MTPVVGPASNNHNKLVRWQAHPTQLPPAGSFASLEAIAKTAVQNYPGQLTLPALALPAVAFPGAEDFLRTQDGDAVMCVNPDPGAACQI